MEASPSPVYGAALLMRLGSTALPGFKSPSLRPVLPGLSALDALAVRDQLLQGLAIDAGPVRRDPVLRDQAHGLPDVGQGPGLVDLLLHPPGDHRLVVTDPRDAEGAVLKGDAVVDAVR